MKNLKKMIMGFAAVAMIVGGSAFANIKRVGAWYRPLASNPSIPIGSTNRLNFANYDSTPLASPPNDCSGTEYVCAAHFNDVDGEPDSFVEKGN